MANLTASQKRHLTHLVEHGVFTLTTRWATDLLGFQTLVQDRSHKGFVTHVFERLVKQGLVEKTDVNNVITFRPIPA